ncbi:PKD domain-containing protein [Benzoatithermus flavus]|uniref:PKD domain-containing protein n=1 Tax=Benzoatithermus flavus TaxID=3108223 RepID=A0ABU8XXT1_9PROT
MGLGARCRSAGRLLLVPLLLGGTAAAAEEPLSVVYGRAAATGEGDPDFREVIYLRIPDDTRERLYLRVFDPDIGGAHDLLYGTWDTAMRYVLFGGSGAEVEAPPLPARSGGSRGKGTERTAVAEPPRPGGEVLADVTVGEDATADDAWRTLASVMPEQGAHVGGAYVFRLEVDGIAGNDANLFTPTLSLRDRRNVAPAGLEILDRAPTIRIPDDRRVIEVRFAVPADAERLSVRTFDAASGRVAFAGTWRTAELRASGQDSWQESGVALLPDERGATMAILLAGGEEIPNDVTLVVTDDKGRVLPMLLPPTSAMPNARPNAIASLVPLADCSAYAFDAGRSSDSDGDRLRYMWEFGDGAGGEGVALVHRYDRPGSYSGVLRVLDDSGRVGNGSLQPFTVSVKRPPRAEAGPTIVASPGEPVRFDGTGSTPGDRPIAGYLWDFQDGSRATGPAPVHAFARSGHYLVTLRVQDDRPGACDSSTAQVAVDVNAAPVAVAGPDYRIAAGETVELDGRRSYDVDGTIADWSWDLGDGTTGSGPVVSHRYDRPGAYPVMLTVQDAAGLPNSVATSRATVVVNDPPIAVAGPDRKAAIGETLTFDAGGSSDPDGKLVRYAWDFGDGAKGSGPKVAYAYGRPGIYVATLTVTDDSGTATSTATASATVRVNAPPIARAGPDQIVTASEVGFDGSASEDPDGTIVRYDWDFGDGTGGGGARPVHVYRQPGAYRVRLTVADDSGTSRSSASDALRVVVNQAPIADAGPDQIGAPGQELTFSGEGSLDPDGDIADYAWDFKDGTTARGERVAHRFALPGVYQVRLTVQDNTGQSDAIAFDEAQVTINAPPVAKAGPDLLAAPGDEVTLDAGNSFDPDGRIASHRWDFSDLPEPAAGRTVKRTYQAPGVYGARLTVTDDSGASNGVAQDEVAIRINHTPVAQAGEDVLAAGSTIAFDGSTSTDADGDPLVHSWDFGDGSPPASGVRVTHTYADGGTYPVVLTVDDGTGLRNAKASAALTVVIDRPPVADAGGNRAVCAGDVVVLDGSRSHDPEGGPLRYHWDFGDGDGADIVNPTKVYRRGAEYPVTLTVEDDSGFPGNRSTDRILVRVAESPIADAGAAQVACAGSEVRFDGSGSRDADGVVNRFTWDFGDGATGGGDRPVHVYGKPGDYRVSLSIEGDQIGQCPSTNTATTMVKVVEAPAARIRAPAAVALGDIATFDASASSTAAGRITGWHWDFGDGGTAEGATVQHAFTQAGRQVVTLTLRTEGGVESCSAVTARHAVIVNAPPVADAGIDRLVGVDDEVLFDGARSHDPDGGIVAYLWDFGDGATASGVDARHRYPRSGRYEVTLTVQDDADLPNSRASDTALVVVNAMPEPVIAAPDVLCPGEPGSFGAGSSHDADGQKLAFAWSFGDGETAQGSDVTHAYRAPGLYSLTLTADDGTGLGNGRGQSVRRLHVNRPPHPEAGPDRRVCPGQEVTFDGSASVDWEDGIASYRWDFGDGVTAEGARVAHAFRGPGLYDVRLSVTDRSGSSCAVVVDAARVTVNAPPVARLGGDREGFAGGAHDQLSFDASASEDADGHPLSFTWDLGDGIVLAGDKVRHAFAKPGLYPVRLTVSDGSGLTCGQTSDTVEVTVRPRP